LSQSSKVHVSRGRGDELLEPLEQRQLLALIAASYGAPVKVAEARSSTGELELHVSATAGNDRLSLARVPGGIAISNQKGGWYDIIDDDGGSRFSRLWVNGARGNDRIIVDDSVGLDAIIYGGAGDDRITSGIGSDRIYPGEGRDRVLAGAGDDVIVTIDENNFDRVNGQDGFDSVWMDDDPREYLLDASAEERFYQAEHRVKQFFQPGSGADVSDPTAPAPVSAVPQSLSGQDLPDPILDSAAYRYADFSDRPLFAPAGPGRDDVAQGAVGDCYLLAVMSSLASVDPMRIGQSIAELGDGTLAVRFFDSRGQAAYVRVDATLPSVRGQTVYADLGQGGSTWAAMIEKAYALYRTNEASYASISGGLLNEAFRLFGMSAQSIYPSSHLSMEQVLLQVRQQLAAGHSVTAATWQFDAPSALVPLHAYDVIDVNLDDAGQPVSIVLRNPWGIDGGTQGSGAGSDDGYITVAPQALVGRLSAFTFA
jgi:Ca2+-binding RTX toxin-like protein